MPMTTEVVRALQARASSPRLREPGPSDAELDTMFRCALHAPDHGLLRPWHYIVFRSAARNALGALLAAAEDERNPAATPEALEKLRRNPLRAPVVIACIAVVRADHPKVPRSEQVASMAAAVQNLQLAAEALGYAAMWRTGASARDPRVKEMLGMRPDDEIVAFLYLGTRDGEPRTREPLLPADFVSHWPVDSAYAGGDA